MKIAVCGSGLSSSAVVAQKAVEVGKILAQREIALLTGGGLGYPYEAARAAFISGATVIGISPAASKNDHIGFYKFPTDAFSDMEYTGLGIPARNYALVREADGIILIGGQAGTLNEFTQAFIMGKPIGILMNTGGITTIINDIVDICNQNTEKELLCYDENPAALIEKLVFKIQIK